MRLLIVEDSESLRTTLKHGLERLNYAVDTVGDGDEAARFIASRVYDVIVLDLMLPGRDGLSLLREMRAAGNDTHVLILSAMSQVGDRIAGLELGADDYLIKPFSFQELKARVDALVRRRYQSKHPVLTIDRLRIDTAVRQVFWDEQPVDLSAKEYTALETLVRNRGTVLTRAQLIERTRDFDADITENAIEVLVSALRRKLRQAGAEGVVETKRGFGYFVRG